MAYRDKNNIPIYPGAYFMNSGTLQGSYSNGIVGYPIYGSIYNYTFSFYSGNTDDYYAVLPGFKLVVYTTTGYSGNTTTFDNTYGTIIKIYTLSSSYLNTGNSCKLYYKNSELSNIYDPSGGSLYTS